MGCGARRSGLLQAPNAMSAGVGPGAEPGTGHAQQLSIDLVDKALTEHDNPKSSAAALAKACRRPTLNTGVGE